MPQPVLVRGFQSNWWIILLRVLGFAGIALGVFLYVQKAGGGLFFLIMGGLVVISVELAAANGRRLLRWIEDTGKGFVVTDRQGNREYRDAQVTAASLETLEHASEGQVKSITQKLSVWVDAQPEPLEMAAHALIGQPDSLQPLRVRLLEGLKQRSETALERGETVEGVGWKLNRTGLEWEPTGGLRDQFRREDFTAIEIHDANICLWTKGERPTIKVPISSKNAHLLYLLLAPKIQERADKSAPPTEGLGRILFERGSNTSTKVLMAFLAVVADLVGIALLFDKEALPWGIGILVVGIFLWIGFASSLMASFRCQEYGVYQKGLTGERQLRYTDVASFRYLVVRHYHNGVYTHTQFTFDFTPDPKSLARPISYSTSLNNADEGLNNLANHISGVIAHRMAGQLKAGERVPWTANLAFLPDGIEYRPAGWFGRGEPLKLPYDRIHNFDIQEGTLHIWERDAPKSVVQESSGEHNFMPGYFLLVLLFTPQEKAASAPEAEAG